MVGTKWEAPAGLVPGAIITLRGGPKCYDSPKLSVMMGAN